MSACLFSGGAVTWDAYHIATMVALVVVTTRRRLRHRSLTSLNAS
jgi:hypothetical protein